MNKKNMWSSSKKRLKEKKSAYLKALKDCSLTCCISYSLLSYILSLLNLNNTVIKGNVWQNNLQLFMMCAVISMLMFLARIIFEPSEKAYFSLSGIAIDLVVVAIPILVMGGPLYNWFDISKTEVLYPILIFMVVYVLAAGNFYLIAKHSEKELNRRINERKERMSHSESVNDDSEEDFHTQINQNQQQTNNNDLKTNFPK